MKSKVSLLCKALKTNFYQETLEREVTREKDLTTIELVNLASFLQEYHCRAYKTQNMRSRHARVNSTGLAIKLAQYHT